MFNMSTKVQLENVSPTIGNTLLAVVHSFREVHKGIAEIQVVTPETAKKLRSLGFNGLSNYYWQNIHGQEPYLQTGNRYGIESPCDGWNSAYSTGELMFIMRPLWSMYPMPTSWFSQDENKWYWSVEEFGIYEELQAEAFAKLLIQLLETGQVEVSDLHYR